MNVSLFTTVMDRPEWLLASLPTWLRLDLLQIVIVDWSSEAYVDGLVQALVVSDDRVLVVRVDDRMFYSQPKSKNTGASLCTGEFILGVDCDVKLATNLLDTIVASDKVYYRGKKRGTTGTFLAGRRAFWDVGGFNEQFQHWGGADVDLYNRMHDAGVERRLFRGDTVEHQSHPAWLRVRRLPHGNRERAREENLKIMAARDWDANSEREHIDYHVTRWVDGNVVYWRGST